MTEAVMIWMMLWTFAVMTTNMHEDGRHNYCQYPTKTLAPPTLPVVVDIDDHDEDAMTGGPSLAISDWEIFEWMVVT